jgi:hypothetical protein
MVPVIERPVQAKDSFLIILGKSRTRLVKQAVNETGLRAPSGFLGLTRIIEGPQSLAPTRSP